MTVPEKIYIAVYPNDDGLDTHLGDWYSEPEYHAEDNLEYIRKDALIEWANGWLAFKKSGIVLDDGFSYAMEELIKKLNTI